MGHIKSFKKFSINENLEQDQYRFSFSDTAGEGTIIFQLIDKDKCLYKVIDYQFDFRDDKDMLYYKPKERTRIVSFYKDPLNLSQYIGKSIKIMYFGSLESSPVVIVSGEVSKV